MAPNNNGHIIRWRDADNHVGTTFEWDIFVIAQDTHGTEEEFTDPDGLWVDPDGRMFIETDGGQPNGGNNQMLVADSSKADEFRRLFTGVRETQHPGNGDPTRTNFPVLNETPDGTTVPRDATFVITRKDGGIVGS